jgi:hypothetical protein
MFRCHPLPTTAMSFEHAHAVALLGTVPWIQDRSFQNTVFEWLKLMHQHPQCKKKQDYEKLLERFRNNSFNRFLHQRQGSTTQDEDAFVKVVCASSASTKQEYVQLFQQLNSFKRVLEPIMGGHLNNVPVVLLWVVESPPNLNEIWYKDEVDSVRDSGVCIQCSGSKTLAHVSCSPPRCPATAVSLCRRGCQMLEASALAAALAKTQPYALTPFGPLHQKMENELNDLFTHFVQQCAGGEPPTTVYNAVWAQQHAKHSDTLNTVLAELHRDVQQTRAALQSAETALHTTKLSLHKTEYQLSNTQQELDRLKAMQKSWERSRISLCNQGRQPQYTPNNPPPRQYHYPPQHPQYTPNNPPPRQYHYPPQHPPGRWQTWRTERDGTMRRESARPSPDVLPYQPPHPHQNTANFYQ